MNKLKFVLPFIVLLAPLGCSEEGRATIDVLKNRVFDQIQGSIGKGDIAIQKYDNKIVEVKANLVKVKVSQKTFERKLSARKASLAKLEESGGSEARISLLDSTIQEMETFLGQIKVAETKLFETYRQLKDDRDLMVLKIKTLEAKRDMLDAMRNVQQYTDMETDIGLIDNTIEDMQQEVDAIESEMEIDKLLREGDVLSVDT
ncbi:MAG: hypothetical protein DRQ49_04180 [Gammaproteobacteria bacterium]|nr:MAG: hypothetical protein DRQ49_04180 [Gammaproteobacteria bacterium]RKZ45389.1 MAG: hypothetical protein DRQ41_00345 [Gammaproteobacteria bacterium]RKZ74178.1 MAG: hypothetical protein DRQ57_11930 [Gammaproteobacteria bacterium]